MTLNPRAAAITAFNCHVCTGICCSDCRRFPVYTRPRSAEQLRSKGAAASRFANVEGLQEKPEDRRYLMLNGVGPKYFETYGTPLIAGRDFEFEDIGPAARGHRQPGDGPYYFGDGKSDRKTCHVHGRDDML